VHNGVGLSAARKRKQAAAPPVTPHPSASGARSGSTSAWDVQRFPRRRVRDIDEGDDDDEIEAEVEEGEEGASGE
jgi:hypothetical protein